MKVSIDFDTQTKEASIKIDGKEVNDVEMVTVSKDYYSKDGKNYLYLSTRKEDTENKLTYYTSIQASKEDPSKFIFKQVERVQDYSEGMNALLNRR